MSTLVATSVSLIHSDKFIPKKSLFTTAIIFGGALLTISQANAAAEITIAQPVTGSTTIVEQYSNGQTATISASPGNISMQTGVPFSTQVVNVPSYSSRQGTTTIVNRGQINSQVTQQIGNSVVTIPTNTGLSTTVNVPVNSSTKVLVPVTTNTVPIINNRMTTTPVVTNTTITTLDAIQLKPTFSTAGVVNANTKVMKILKDSSGRDVAVPANSIKPGDTIEYHTTYVNNGAQQISDLNAMVSLPTGVRVVSLNSPLPTLATTGGDSYQTIQQVGNTVVVQENYSGLKWNLANLTNNTPQTIVIRAKVQ